MSILGPGLKAFGQTPTAPSLLPYMVTLLAGGAATSPAAGATCPVSGFTSTDKFGDGCLATEVTLNAPRFVVQDKLGNTFFSDTKNAIVRRVDATTGVISLVAGGAAANPAAGAACASGVGTSSDADGDGCLGTDVKLGLPHGLAFSPSGDLYFADNSFSEIRKIAATNGFITKTGVISIAVGNAGTFGYNVNTYSGTTLTSSVTVGTQTGTATSLSYLNDPSGIAFDARGDLYIADEGSNAIEVVNLGTSDTTIMGLPVPMGTIAKVIGYGSNAECTNFISTSSTANKGACKFGSFVSGNPARTSPVDSVYDVAVDTAGNVYFANEFIVNVGMISAATGNVINYAGTQNATTAMLATDKATNRGPATSLVIGSDFSVAVDPGANLYIADSSPGVIWRVDAGSSQMYALAGGATTVCSAAKDAVGDGCPASQTTFSGVGPKFASSNSPGVAGLRFDQYGNLLVTDAMANLVRKISNGTQFGTINGSKPTQMVDIHFGIGDGPGSNAYTLTVGAGNFVLGSASCAANSDQTTDCILPVQATPTIPGAFGSTLTVTSAKGLTSNFALGGNFSPVAAASSTNLVVSTAAGCSGTAVGIGTQVTITSTSTGPGGTPTGTVTFFNGTTQIGTPQTLNSSGQASVTTTFAAAGSDTITAVYSGDPFFLASTSASSTLTVVAPSYSVTLNSQQVNSIAAGQAALYSFTLASTVYTGSINFACSGLPSGSSCIFSPSTVAETTGCSNSQTVTLSIVTTQATPVKQSSLGVSPFGRGPWAALGMLPGLGLALLITVRRRKNPSLKYGQIWMGIALLLVVSGVSACGSGTKSTPGTPAGTSTVTVTASDASGHSTPVNITLTVH